MSFVPSNLSLTNLFTNSINTSKETHVFGNGKMQAMVFPAASYTGTLSQKVKAEIKKYIAKNTNIYVITELGEKKLLEWTKSTVSNEFLHDIYIGGSGTESDELMGDSTDNFTAPIFFLVPNGMVGKFNWIAELHGKFIFNAEAITVNCQKLAIEPGNFQIVDVTTNGNAILRDIRYNLVGTLANTALKLRKCLEYEGLLFKDTSGNFASCWVSASQIEPLSQFACFVKYQESSPTVAVNGKTYDKNDFCSHNEGNFSQLQTATINEATSDPYSDVESLTVTWETGVPVILLKDCIIKAYGDHIRVVMGSNRHFKLQDNFGNEVAVKFAWNDPGYYQWKVTDAVIA